MKVSEGAEQTKDDVLDGSQHEDVESAPGSHSSPASTIPSAQVSEKAGSGRLSLTAALLETEDGLGLRRLDTAPRD